VGRLVDHRRRSLLVARLRLLAVAGVFCLLATAALSRIAWVGMVQPDKTRLTMAEALLPARGEITNRNGVPLARAFPAYALWFNPRALDDGGTPLVKSPEEVASALVAIFPDLDRVELTRQLAEGRAGYIRRRVLPEEVNRVNAIGELALEATRETDRHYPQGALAAHVLGYVNANGQGMLGMETVLNEQLTHGTGRATPVALSIDARVQGALEDELMRGMSAVSAKGAAGIVLDVDSGEVLALASLPHFDPNNVQASDVMVSPEAHARGEVPPAFNRMTNQVYELGSTFKPLTVAAAIDAGVITSLGRRWQANRPLETGGKPIGDSHIIGASLNVPETLIHSSNIVSAQIAGELGPDRLQNYLIGLGMGERPQIELPGRGYPLSVNGQWNSLKAKYVGFGHGVAVTPLHLASAYAAMVNGGVWRPSTLLRREPGEIPQGRRVFQPSTSARMNQLLRLITLYGTGRNADAPGFRVGGKTGSAEKPGASRTDIVATFAAAFPMDRPRFVVIAMLDEPRGTAASSFQRTAAWNAAPIVGRLVPRIGPLLGVLPDADRDIDLTDLRPLVGGA
jgi:cell division protein FtsI (penicillin-binding protein 3)